MLRLLIVLLLCAADIAGPSKPSDGFPEKIEVRRCEQIDQAEDEDTVTCSCKVTDWIRGLNSEWIAICAD